MKYETKKTMDGKELSSNFCPVCFLSSWLDATFKTSSSIHGLSNLITTQSNQKLWSKKRSTNIQLHLKIDKFCMVKLLNRLLQTNITILQTWMKAFIEEVSVKTLSLVPKINLLAKMGGQCLSSLSMRTTLFIADNLVLQVQS